MKNCLERYKDHVGSYLIVGIYYSLTWNPKELSSIDGGEGKDEDGVSTTGGGGGG